MSGARVWRIARWLLVGAAAVFALWLLDRNVGLGARVAVQIDDPWVDHPYVRPLPAGAFVTTMDTRGAERTLVAARTIPVRVKPPRTYRDLTVQLVLGPSDARAFAIVFPGPIGQSAHTDLVWHRDLAALDWPRIDDGTFSLYQRPGTLVNFDSITTFRTAAPQAARVASLLVDPPVGQALDFDALDLTAFDFLLTPTPYWTTGADGGTFETRVVLATVGNDHRTYTFELRTASGDLLDEAVAFRSLALTFRGQSLWRRFVDRLR